MRERDRESGESGGRRERANVENVNTVESSSIYFDRNGHTLEIVTKEKMSASYYYLRR